MDTNHENGCVWSQPV